VVIESIPKTGDVQTSFSDFGKDMNEGCAQQNPTKARKNRKEDVVQLGVSSNGGFCETNEEIRDETEER
jgi:hypothetical protein